MRTKCTLSSCTFLMPDLPGPWAPNDVSGISETKVAQNFSTSKLFALLPSFNQFLHIQVCFFWWIWSRFSNFRCFHKNSKWFWTYFPGFTRSVSRLVHPANHPTSLPQVMAPWTDFELKQRKPLNKCIHCWCGGVQVPNCLTRYQSLKSVKRTRTVLTY